MSMKNILQISKKFLNHPIGRGMVSYGMTFPLACFIQEYYDKRNLENINWRKCLRYSLYGVFITSPTLYVWIRIASKIWPKQTLSTGIQKALLEQVSYGPAAMSLFFFVMAYAENNYDATIAVNEVQRKFWDTVKVQICYWPFVQTINFAFVPERNRLVFVSFASLLWVIFLTYVDQHGSPFKPKSEKLKSDESDGSPVKPKSEKIKSDES